MPSNCRTKFPASIGLIGWKREESSRPRATGGACATSGIRSFTTTSSNRRMRRSGNPTGGHMNCSIPSRRPTCTSSRRATSNRPARRTTDARLRKSRQLPVVLFLLLVHGFILVDGFSAAHHLDCTIAFSLCHTDKSSLYYATNARGGQTKGVQTIN